MKRLVMAFAALALAGMAAGGVPQGERRMMWMLVGWTGVENGWVGEGQEHDWDREIGELRELALENAHSRIAVPPVHKLVIREQINCVIVLHAVKSMEGIHENGWNNSVQISVILVTGMDHCHSVTVLLRQIHSSFLLSF